MEIKMTEVQREVFLFIDEYWIEFGFGPSLRDICIYRKKPGLGNTAKIIDRLVKLGVLKRVKGMGRSVRPVYLNFRKLD
jgi:sulfur relay (sulfurtransferase) DsrC/TusE family protein